MTTVRLHRFSDIIALVPYQLGYQPENSIVVNGMKSGTAAVTARLDLPDPDDVEAAADVVDATMGRSHAQDLVLVGYETTAGDSELVARALRRRAEARGLAVAGDYVVRSDRWWCRTCDHAPACPPEGTEVLRHHAPGVAEYVAMGRAPLASRSLLGEAVEPRRPLLTAAVRDQISRYPVPPTVWDPAVGGEAVQAWARRGAVAWAHVLSCPGPRADEAALAVVSLRDLTWRDALVARLAPVAGLGAVVPASLLALLEQEGVPGGSEPADADADLAIVRQLTWLAAAVPDDLGADAAAVLTVLACVHWAHGRGTEANVAVARALRVAPDYRLAQLVESLIGHGVRFDQPAPATQQRHVA